MFKPGKQLRYADNKRCKRNQAKGPKMRFSHARSTTPIAAPRIARTPDARTLIAALGSPVALALAPEPVRVCEVEPVWRVDEPDAVTDAPEPLTLALAVAAAPKSSADENVRHSDDDGTRTVYGGGVTGRGCSQVEVAPLAPVYTPTTSCRSPLHSVKEPSS